MYRILITDDEEKLRGLLARIISLEGYDVMEASDGKSALRILESSEIDIVLCDVKLPDVNGVELVKTIKSRFPRLEIILLTAYGNIPDGVQAIKNGAFDYITKGDDNNKIVPLISRAVEKIELSDRVKSLEKQLESKHSFESISGKSKSLMQAVEAAKKVAPTDATVLLTGETGTGKEVFAKAIHQASKRSTKNFVAINCSAFSKELLESEMFGHTSGAFTGAKGDKKGLFSEANGGTIFLDEIGEMAPELQAKLLRVLETGEFIKVGEVKTTKVNVRIIAATNRDLLHEIHTGNFREDLYYRVSVFTIHLPSLRDRVSDIPELAMNFLHQFSAKTNKKINSINQTASDALMNHTWKGNVRELKNVIERAVILCDESEIQLDNLPPEFIHKNQYDAKQPLSAFNLASAEKLHIQKVLNYTKGNKTETARLLNIALTTLYRKIEEYKLS